VFGVGMLVPDYGSVLVEEGNVQHDWPAVVDWVGTEYVKGVCKVKICCIADVD